MIFQRDQLEKYLPRYLVYSLLWSFSGDSKMKYREELGKMIQKITTIPLPNTSVMPLIDYEVYACRSFMFSVSVVQTKIFVQQKETVNIRIYDSVNNFKVQNLPNRF
jgi:hypothetical protein